MKMSLHRALEEKKLNDKKIENKIRKLDIFGTRIADELVCGKFEPVKFEHDAKADFQSINDLIKRQSALKSAIAKKNTEVMVVIFADQAPMSIIDAVNMKNQIIEYKTILLRHLERQYDHHISQCEQYNAKIENQAQSIAEKSAGAENNKKHDPKMFAEIRDTFIKTRKCELIDPIDIKSKIQKIETEIDEFNANVGAVLSEANALNFIEI